MFLDALQGLARRWYVVLLSAAGILAVALFLAKMQPNRYTATAQLLIEPRRSRFGADAETGALSYYYFYRHELQTQMRLMESRPVAERVVRALNLGEDGPFVGVPDPVEIVKSSVMIEPIGETRFVKLSIQTTDPEWSAKIANALADAYIAESLESRKQLLFEAIGEYASRFPELDEKLQKAEAELLAFQEKHMIISSARPEESLGREEDKLLQEQARARQERIEAESRLKQFKSGDVNGDNFMGLARTVASEDPWVRQVLETRLAHAARVLDLRKSFSDGHRELESAKTRLAEIERELGQAVKGYSGRAQRGYEAAVWKEEEVQRLLDGHRARTAQVAQWFARYESLRQRRDSLRALLDPLARGQAELGLAASIDLANARVIELAVVPQSASSPRRLNYAFAGLVLGVILGSALALLIESLDETVRSAEDVRRAAGLSTVGAVSAMSRRVGRDARARALVTSEQASSSVGEQFRSIRTGVLAGAPWKDQDRGGVVIVTSANMGEGKTTVALNTAQAFARLGDPVVVVDADLRRGAIHKLFDVPISPGLVELLEGEAKLEDTIRPTKVPNLFVLPGGRETVRPAELLASEKAHAVIRDLRDSYATVWIDAPPIVPVADTRNLTSVADMLLIVVKPFETGHRALQRTCELLRASNAPVMHVVLNGIPPSVEKQYGYPSKRYKEYSRTGDAPVPAAGQAAEREP